MNLIEKLIIGWNFLTLKLLFEKVINNNYNISEFKFISHSKNLFIDGFSLEYGNYNYIKKTNRLLKPIGHISKYYWFRNYHVQTSIIDWVLELFSS